MSVPPRAGSKAAITSARPPNAPNVIPPARYLPSVVRSGITPVRACTPPALIRDVITSSKISSDPVVSHASAQRCEERRARRDAAGGAHHRLDEHRRDVAVDGAAQTVDVVVRDAPEVERGEQCLTAVAEVEQAAVVRAVDDDDHVAAGVMTGELDRHQVRFRPGVREAHLFDRREAGADRLGEADLVDVDAAVAPAALERAAHRSGDR